MKRLDLHGKRHDEVETQVINFIYKNNPPFEIITGNSKKMREIVLSTISKHGFSAIPKGLVNYGSFIITERNTFCLVCGCTPCNCSWGC
jgi:hypothetical protein